MFHHIKPNKKGLCKKMDKRILLVYIGENTKTYEILEKIKTNSLLFKKSLVKPRKIQISEEG